MEEDGGFEPSSLWGPEASESSLLYTHRRRNDAPQAFTLGSADETETMAVYSPGRTARQSAGCLSDATATIVRRT